MGRRPTRAQAEVSPRGSLRRPSQRLGLGPCFVESRAGGDARRTQQNKRTETSAVGTGVRVPCRHPWAWALLSRGELGPSEWGWRVRGDGTLLCGGGVCAAPAGSWPRLGREGGSVSGVKQHRPVCSDVNSGAGRTPRGMCGQHRLDATRRLSFPLALSHAAPSSSFPQVAAALAAGEASPLALWWRRVVQGYLALGKQVKHPKLDYGSRAVIDFSGWTTVMRI